MIEPQIPQNESERLNALYKLKILDSPAEDRFERIIDLTADFFTVPICYISFVDQGRQWLKASCGLNFQESNRSVSFCGHTINYEEILVVPDASKDERFHDNPLVIGEPYMKFYAGVPLRTIDSNKIGTLCIAKPTPDQFDRKDIRQLKNFAALVEDQINLYDSLYLKNEIIEQKKRIEKQSVKIEQSISCARNIQISTIQSENEFQDIVPQSFVFQSAKNVLSGDFFFANQVKNLRYIAAADCTGHGVPGAMVSITCHNALDQAIREVDSNDVGKILDRTNEIVIERFTSKNGSLNDGMDIFIICHDVDSNIVYYAGANSPAYLFRKSDHDITEPKVLIPNRQPVGRFSKSREFTTAEIAINDGDTIYMCSDGFQDQFGGPENRKFGRKRLRALFTSLQSVPLEDRRTSLIDQFNEWKGDTAQIDDILVMGLYF